MVLMLVGGRVARRVEVDRRAVGGRFSGRGDVTGEKVVEVRVMSSDKQLLEADDDCCCKMRHVGEKRGKRLEAVVCCRLMDGRRGGKGKQR